MSAKRVVAFLATMSIVGMYATNAHAAPGIPGGGGSDAPEQTSTATVDTAHRFYLGADYQQARLSVSNSGSVGGLPVDDYDTRFVDLRVGYRVLEAIGVEAHYGIPTGSGDSDGNVKASQYYAGYIVPTGTVFEAVEISAPIGYSYSKLKQNDAQASLSGVAFGLNIELPLHALMGWFPDVRLTSGGTVFNHSTEARYYGYHGGLRYDFGL